MRSLISVPAYVADPGPPGGPKGQGPNPFGHSPLPGANDVKAVPDLPKRPKPLGPYSHCVVANGLVFISAQAPIRPGGKAGEWAAPDIAGQTRQCLTNIASILEELGLTLTSVVKTTVFLVDPADFQAMNEAYKEFFPEEPPARS